MEGMCVKFDVIGLDSPCVDLAVNVRCFPKPNGAERIQNLSWQGGGKVASGMVAAARLGLCCGIMGNVGDDKYGTFCLRDFQDHGIDTEQMCVRKNRTTNFDIVISDEGSMGRSFVFYPGNAECMTEEELNIEYISNSSYFYMANLDSVTKKAAQMAKQKGSKIFMDADSYTDELLDAISWIDIFIGSEFVYEKMLEAGKSVKENCEYLYNKGPEIVIFTFGEKGCAGISKEGFFEIPAFDVDVKDKAKVKDILTYATENKFGVAAINTLNIETVKYVIEAAERERVPIIVQFYPGFSDYTDLKHLAFAACDMAEKASIPVGVHLDHSVTYEIAVGGIRDGFPSVMIDGSTKSFQGNVELTKNVVRVAKVFGVDVEAELGHVGNGDSIDAIDNTNYYTKVEDAVRFVEQTGCDSLAIAVGNAHGPYVKTPNLDLERIYAIRKKVNIPLVLHGCSDIPEEQMKEAVNLGMSKFNIATEYFRTMYQSIEKRINNQEFEGNGVKLMYDIKEEMIDFVIQKIRLLNPNKYSM